MKDGIDQVLPAANEEREIGLRGNDAANRLREWVVSIPEFELALETDRKKPFQKGACILRSRTDNRFVLACITRSSGIYTSLAFYYGKSYGKYPLDKWEVDEDVPRTPKVGYFLLSDHQLGSKKEIDLSVFLRNAPGWPPFEERMRSLRNNFELYTAQVLPDCLKRVLSVDPPGYEPKS